MVSIISHIVTILFNDSLTIKIYWIVWIVMVCNVNKYSDMKRKPMHFLNFILTLEKINFCKINHRKDHIFGKCTNTFFEFLILPSSYKVVGHKDLQLGLQVGTEIKRLSLEWFKFSDLFLFTYFCKSNYNCLEALPIHELAITSHFLMQNFKF